MNVVYVYADSQLEWNTSEWRCLALSDAMNKANSPETPWSAKLIHVSGFENYMSLEVQNWVAPADIIVFQRNIITDQAIDAVHYWQGMGKPVVADLDDAYQMLPWSNPAHRFWMENPGNLPEKPLQLLRRGLAACNGLISPNRLLLQDWDHVVHGYYIPNYARREWWSDLPDRAKKKAELGISDRIIIGWGGSISHYDSWWGSGIREACKVVARAHPEVMFVICGNDPRIYEQLPVPIDQKRMQPGVPQQDWPKVVSTFDIGLAPLYEKYDQRRSWIKGLEYGLAGIPWIGSYGEPYRDLAKFGKLVKDGEDKWAEAMLMTIHNLDKETRLAQQSVSYFQTLFIDAQLDYVKQMYEQIINDFRGDYGRLPDLTFVNWSNK